MQPDDDMDGARRLLRSLMERPDRSWVPQALTVSEAVGLNVPRADAATVINVTRTVLGPVASNHLDPWRLSTLPTVGFTELSLLAEALVVDEHPSAPDWTTTDRHRIAAWIAALIEHQGEEGVEHLLDALRLEPRPGPGEEPPVN